MLGYRRGELLPKTIDVVSYHGKEVPKLFAEYLQRGWWKGEYVLKPESGLPIPIKFQLLYFLTAATPRFGS